MASVRVARDRARNRGLPLISVRSGDPADGYVDAGRPPYVMKVPLTQAEFDQVQALKIRKKTSVYGGVACVAIGIAMARFPVLLPLGVIIGVLSAGLWVVIWLQLRRILPDIEPGPGADEITLDRVHKAFAAAVRDSAD